MTDIHHHQAWTDTVAIYPGAGTGNEKALTYVGLQLASEAGEVAGKIAKMFRDDGGQLSNERRAAIIKEAGDVYWYLARLCRELRVNPSEVLMTNIDKINDRNERDKLKGSGDDR